MINWMSYLNAFIVGGVLCACAQILIDKTKLTPARILVLFVTMGVFLSGIGVYEKIVSVGGAGATVPLTGFGHTLAKGAIKDVSQNGLIGAFTGGVKAAAAGITAAIFFGYMVSLVFKPKPKR